MVKALPPALAEARNNELRRQQATKKNKPNILWWSNAPWAPTGYGTQTNAVVPRLSRAGHKVAVSANYGLAGQSQMWGDVPVFPSGFQKYSQDMIYGHWQAWDSRNPGPTLLMSLYDVWVMNNVHLPKVPLLAPWVPVDHNPAPPAVAAWCRRENVYPVAMSQFGQAMLQQADVDALYVPHSVDTKVFHPDKRAEGRELLGADDRFVVMMTAANKGTYPNRKAFPQNILAFAEFARRHPDALLYLHTAMKGTGGIDLEELLAGININPEQVKFVDQFNYLLGMPDTTLASLMAGADVFLSVSLGEGFGIPVVEAQAAGTPVIVNDWTAQPELVGDGWKTPGDPYWDIGQNAFYKMPFVGGIVEALENAYQNRQDTSTKARKFAEHYDHDVVFEQHWQPTMRKLTARLGDRLAAAGVEGGSGPGGSET